jgi:hypothetical protein
MNPTDWKPNESPLSIHNPLTHDFTCSYRNEDNSTATLTIPAMDIVTLPTWLAEYAIKHLIDEMINERNLGFVTPQQRKKLESEVRV